MIEREQIIHILEEIKILGFEIFEFEEFNSGYEIELDKVYNFIDGTKATIIVTISLGIDGELHIFKYNWKDNTMSNTYTRHIHLNNPNDLREVLFTEFLEFKY